MEEKEVVEEVVMNKVEVEVEEKAAPKKRKPRSAKKVAVVSSAFDGSKYKETKSIEEKIAVRQLNRRGQLVVEQTPTGRFVDKEVFTDEFVRKYGGGTKENKTAFHRAKCCFRTGEAFGVDLEQIAKGYVLLSGKKIDGFFITDLIDRFGWSNGEQVSRNQLKDKYKKVSVQSVNIAQDKLRDILKSSDIEKAYVDLVKDIKDEFAKELHDKTVYGE